MRWGFVPIWQVREQEKEATVPGNLFDHAIIQWPVVLGLTAAIALVGGWMFLGARTKSIGGVTLFLMANRLADVIQEKDVHFWLVVRLFDATNVGWSAWRSPRTPPRAGV